MVTEEVIICCHVLLTSYIEPAVLKVMLLSELGNSVIEDAFNDAIQELEHKCTSLPHLILLRLVNHEPLIVVEAGLTLSDRVRLKIGTLLLSLMLLVHLVILNFN